MSEGERGAGKPGEVPWKTITRVADEAEREETERLLAATDEELDAELKEAGFAPGDAANVVAAALGKTAAPKTAPTPPAAPPAKVVSLDAARSKRARPARWLPLVAAAAAVAVVLGGGGAAYVALRTPEPAPSSTVPGATGIPSAPPTAPPEMLAKRDADARRALAAKECAAKEWSACLADLDEAAERDPAGASAPATRRLRGKANRGAAVEEREAKQGAVEPRKVMPDERARVVTLLGPRAGQAVRVVCARAPEATRYCGQLAAALTAAGWGVTRETMARDAGTVHGVGLTVAAPADDATEDAAEALAEGLGRAYVMVRGPDDVPAAPGSPGPALTLTVGEQ